MKFTVTKKQIKPGMFKKVIREESSDMTYNKKSLMRYKINNEIFDLHDSVADNAKMISLIFALLSRIWNALPEDIKDNIAESERQIIDYAFNKYHSIETRADIEFETNGAALIDKLMNRQAKIGEIYKTLYLG